MASVLGTVRSGVKMLVGASAVVAGVCFLAIFVVNIVQIVMRSFFGGGFIWVTDLSELLFVWTVLLGIAVAYHERSHIVIDFVLQLASDRVERVLAWITRGVEVGLFAILVWAGLEVAAGRVGISYIQLGISTRWAYLAVPVAGVVMLLSALTLPIAYERRAARDDIEQ